MILICTLFLLYFIGVEGQKLPDIPCPDVFKYMQDNGIIYGLIQVPNDYSGKYEIAVNVSLAVLLERGDIQIKLVTPPDELSQGADPVHRVDFPIQSVIPKITEITFNKKVYCSGDPEPISTRGVTNMWAKRSYFSGLIPRRKPTTNPAVVSYTTRPIGTPERLQPDVNRTLPWTPPTTPQTPRTTVFTTRIPTTRIPTIRIPTTSISVITTPSTTTLPPFMNPAIRERSRFDCGVFSQQLLSGGAEVQKGEFPWLVSLWQKLQSNYNYKCTGNLISDKHVISAGHCFKILGANYKKEDFVVVLGKQDISNWAVRSTIRGIEEMYIHNNYRYNTGDNDIAVLVMDEPVEFTATIKPICLWSDTDDYNIIGQVGTVVGWRTDGNKKASKTDLVVVSNEDCLKSHWGYANITSGRTFCAGGNGVGPCSGDSGAGIIMQRDGFWTLRGIVSQPLQSKGTVMCELGKYIVFADVKSFSQWIEQMMMKS